MNARIIYVLYMVRLLQYYVWLKVSVPKVTWVGWRLALFLKIILPIVRKTGYIS